MTFAIVLLTNGVLASGVVRFGAGNAAAIQSVINQFRIDLGGVDNGTGSHFTSGRREVNWDDVPDSAARPNTLEPNFFNTTIAKGLVMNTLEFETGSGHNDFFVSADSSNPSNTPIRFGDLNSTYPGFLTPFSGERIMTPRLTSMLEIHFFIPGTNIPATVKGFGIVFVDADSTLSGQRSIIRCYDTKGAQMGSFAPLPSNNGFSFVGVSFNGANERIARCTIEAGNVRLQADTFDGQNSFDIVAMDDFIFGEPQAASYHQGDFDGDGSADLNIYRPTTNEWFIFQTGTNTIFQTTFGQLGDEPLNGDYDGDARGDLAVFRGSTGEWFRQLSTGGFVVDVLGTTGDRPVPGDYDRDGKTDLAVWRPTDGSYLVSKSGGGNINTLWGQTGDVPINASAGKGQ